MQKNINLNIFKQTMSLFYSHVYSSIIAANQNQSIDKVIISSPPEYSVTNTLNEFYKIYNKNKDKSIHDNLKSTLFSFFWRRYLLMFWIRIYITISEFTGPYIMSQILHYTKSAEILEENKHYCYLYILSLILFYFLRSVFQCKYEYFLNMIRNQLEIIFSDLINKKILRVDHNIKNLDGEVSEIFGSEISSIYCLFININYSWELPFCIGFALYLTYKQVSYAFVPGLVFAVLLIFLNYKVATNITSSSQDMKLPRTQRKQSELMAIKNIKNVKYFSLEKYFLNEIYVISLFIKFHREKEFKLLTIKKYLDALCCYLWAATPVLISFSKYQINNLVTIFSYILGGNLIDSEKVFTTISLFNMTIHPLNVFPWIYSSVKGSIKSFERICDFLSIKDKPENSITKPNLLDDKEFVYIKNTKVKYSKDSDFTLLIDEFICKKGDLVILYGTNGSGKTAFIKSLLKENLIINESQENMKIKPDLKIGYIPQDLWTFNTSIKENIEMGQNLSKEIYKTLIDCCDLEKDFKTMKNFDSTVIATKGANISGGQKQRVNIARCLAQVPDIVIMDNPFSSIDNNVADKIFNQAISTLREKGVSVIFSTCDKKWISVSDNVYIINNNILSKLNIGKRDKLTDYTNYDYSKNNDKIKEETSQNNVCSEVVKKEEIQLRVNYKTYNFYFYHTGKVFFVIVIIFVGLMQFGRNFIEIWLADWVNNENMSGFKLEEKKEIQIKNLKVYVVFIILHSLATTGRSAFFAQAGLKAAKEIYIKFVNKLIYSSCNYFINNDLGKISNLLENDVKCVDEELPFEFNRLLAYTFTILGSILVIGYSSLLFIVLFMVLGVYYVHIFKLFIPAGKILSKENNKNYSEWMNTFFDMIEGRVVIRSYKKEEYFRQIMLKKLENKINSSHTEQLLGKWMGMRLDFISYSLSSLICILMGYCIYIAKYDAITFLSLALTYSLNINSSLSSFIPWINEVELKFTAVQRIRENMDSLEEEDLFSLNEKGLNDDAKDILEYKNVFLKYDNDDTFILKNVSFNIKRNSKIGIIGRTGAGKTSVFNTIIKLYEIQKGEIIFNGVNINRYNNTQLRKDIIVISREPLIIQGKLKKNLDIYEKYEKEQIREFLQFNFGELLQQKDFSFLQNLDYEIHSEGSNISEGQKSIIQLLRGVLLRPSLICMDEFNAELDNETESLILDLMLKKFPQITFIAIVHKLYILEKFDYIYVIENGEIVDKGIPSEMLKRSYISEIK